MRALIFSMSLLLGFTSNFASTEENAVKRVDLPSITAWSFTTESPLTSSPSIFKQQIYIGDSGGTVYALNAKDGSLLWKVKRAAAVKTRLLATDRGVVVAAGNLLSVLDKKGRQKWERKIEGTDASDVLDPWDIYRSSPYQYKNTIYIGSDNGAVYGFNLRSGKTVYRCETPKAVPVRNQPLVDGEHIYFGNWEGEFFACSLKTGDIVWQYDTREDITFSWKNSIQNRPVVHEDKVCFTGRHCRLYCLNKATGKRVFGFASPTDQWLIGDPLKRDSRLFFGTSDQYLLYGFDLNKGEKLWESPTRGRTWGAPAVSGDFIYVVNNALQKIRLSDGKLTAEAPLQPFYEERQFGSYADKRPSSHSDVLVHEGQLIFAADKGEVIATQAF